MNLHQLTTAEVLHSLKSQATGLSEAEATRRLQEYGENRVHGIRREPLWLRFFRELTHFFAIIMWLAAALAFVAEWSAPGEGMAKVGISLVVVIFISALFSFWQEYRVEKSLEALQKLLPTNVKVFREREVRSLPAASLVPGDVILLEQGDNVPADCRVLQSDALGVNNATLTGESLTQLRSANASSCENVLDADNILLAGTAIMAGEGTAVVFATGMSTQFGKITHLTETSGGETSPLRKEIAYVSRLIAVVALSLGGLFFIVGHFIGVPLWHDVLFAIGIIVAMVPEGLLPTLTLALVLAAQRMVKRNVLIRHLPAIETLGSTTVICTDKTGTLTQNRMVTERLWLGGSWLDIDTSGNVQLATEQLATEQLATEQLAPYQPLFDCAAWCNDLHKTHSKSQTSNTLNSSWLGDPMEVALYEMALQLSPPQNGGTRLHTIPFDNKRMRLSVVRQTANGTALYCKGAPEKLLPLCDQILMNGECVPLTDTLRVTVTTAQEAMAEAGLRVLAFAWKPIPDGSAETAQESGMVFCGLAGLDDPIRPEVPDAIQHCHAAGIRVIMITGDHPRTAVAIARKIGLLRQPDAVAITGDQLEQLTASELQLALDAQDIVFARVAPEQKMHIVQALKAKQQIVAVTGDGVNDAPALKAAHIGIAMGITGTDVAREAADMVLLDDNFASIVNGVEEGRAVFANIRKFLTYILSHNVPELVPYLAFVLFPVPLALTPIQILAVDMAADSVTAIGLGSEKPDPAVMRQPPRPLGERLMNPFTAWRAYAFLGVIEAAAAMTLFFLVLYQGGWVWGQAVDSDTLLYRQATSGCFGAILLMQVFNVFICRNDTLSVFSLGLRSNRLVLAGVALELVILVLGCYTPLGNWLIGTAPLNPIVWLAVLPFALVMLGLDEILKWRRRKAQTGKLLSV